MKLSDAHAAILTAAGQHPEHLAIPPERLLGGARQKVAQVLLKQNLVITVHRPGYDAVALWPVDGDAVLLRITDEGLRAISIEPADADEQSEAALLRRNAGGGAAVESDMPQDLPAKPAEACGAAEAPAEPAGAGAAAGSAKRAC